MRMRTALAVSGVVVLALGCAAARSATGTHGNSRYERQMKVAGQELFESLRALSIATGISLHYPVEPTAARRAVAVLTKAEAKLHDAARELKSIAPPAAVSTQHTALMKATVELAGELKPVIAKLRQGYLIAASKLVSLPGAKKIGVALAALNKRGYRIGAT